MSEQGMIVMLVLILVGVPALVKYGPSYVRWANRQRRNCDLDGCYDEREPGTRYCTAEHERQHDAILDANWAALSMQKSSPRD